MKETLLYILWWFKGHLSFWFFGVSSRKINVEIKYFQYYLKVFWEFLIKNMIHIFWFIRKPHSKNSLEGVHLFFRAYCFWQYHSGV